MVTAGDRDMRWGPANNILEYTFWPAYSAFVPKRLSELGVYRGRIALGYGTSMIMLIILICKRKGIGNIIKTLTYLIVVSGLLWGATTGYIRYGLFVEIISAIYLSMLCMEWLSA